MLLFISFNIHEKYSTDRSFREPIISQVSAMHARLGQLFETLAAWARGQWTTVNRARLADILQFLPFHSLPLLYGAFLSSSIPFVVLNAIESS